MPANLGSTNKVKRIILINIVSESENASTQPRVKQGKACLPTRVVGVVGRKGRGRRMRIKRWGSGSERLGAGG